MTKQGKLARLGDTMRRAEKLLRYRCAVQSLSVHVLIVNESARIDESTACQLRPAYGVSTSNQAAQLLVLKQALLTCPHCKELTDSAHPNKLFTQPE